MAVAVASVSANAITVEKQGSIASVKAIRAIAEETSIVELPAKAAEIVTAAKEENRKKVAIRTVRVFLQGHHSLAPSLVGAIAKAAPEVAAAVASEAIALFPESAYSITKAAVAAAPDYAVQIAMSAAANNRASAGQIRAGVQRALPNSSAAQFNNVLTALNQGERVETAELAIVTVKVRIGSSSAVVPADPTNTALNVPGETSQQQVFAGVEQTVEEVPVVDDNGDPVTDDNGDPVTETVVTFVIDTGNIEVADDLTGQEAADQFDIIARVLDTNNNAFVEEVTVEAYVN